MMLWGIPFVLAGLYIVFVRASAVKTLGFMGGIRHRRHFRLWSNPSTTPMVRLA